MKFSERHWLLAKFPFLPESAEAVSYYIFERGALGCEENGMKDALEKYQLVINAIRREDEWILIETKNNV